MAYETQTQTVNAVVYVHSAGFGSLLRFGWDELFGIFLHQELGILTDEILQTLFIRIWPVLGGVLTRKRLDG